MVQQIRLLEVVVSEEDFATALVALDRFANWCNGQATVCNDRGLRDDADWWKGQQLSARRMRDTLSDSNSYVPDGPAFVSPTGPTTPAQHAAFVDAEAHDAAVAAALTDTERAELAAWARRVTA